MTHLSPTPRPLFRRAAAALLLLAAPAAPALAGTEGAEEIAARLDACFADPAALADAPAEFDKFTAPGRCAAAAVVACTFGEGGVDDPQAIACVGAVADRVQAEALRRQRAAPVGDPPLVAAIRERTALERRCSVKWDSGTWLNAQCRAMAALAMVETLAQQYGE